MIKKSNFIILILLFFSSAQAIPLYFCTGANSAYFNRLMNLIGSIHKTNYASLEQIAVFDLGLSSKEIDTLRSIDKVMVYQLQKTHPEQLKYFTLPTGQRWFGWYTWKPVIIKQALDMFGYVVWLDAGTTVLKPLDHLFQYIANSGYFICTIGNEHENSKWRHPIGWSATKFLINTFNLHHIGRRWILSQESVMGGVIGVARNSLFYEKFLLPLYKYTKDFRYFADDGTSAGGYGAGRHDQTIMSILAYLNGWHIFKQDYTQSMPIYLRCDNTETSLYITWLKEYVDDRTDIYSSRGDLAHYNEYVRCIQYR